MSLNRVLNRPMFRREALRKGVLKPIKARVGRFFKDLYYNKDLDNRFLTLLFIFLKREVLTQSFLDKILSTIKLQEDI